MTKHISRAWFLLLVAGLGTSVLAAAGSPAAAAPPAEPLIGSLKGIPPPLPNLSGIVKSREWAIALGKALFYDQQLGSEGQACASCHFSAGADSRIVNQLHPGDDSAFGGIDGAASPPEQTGLMKSGAVAGPNIALTPADFPFHQLADPTDRSSAILFTTSDRVSSQGVFAASFLGLDPGQGGPGLADDCVDVEDQIFHVGNKRSRRVAGRNTPSMINAVYNYRTFWDGRANSTYNGTSPFGSREIQGTPGARVVVLTAAGAAGIQAFRLQNASLASQANGPPLSAVEMSCNGRTFADLGRKMLSVRPLAQQAIDPADSVLGAGSAVGNLRAPNGQGLLPAFGYGKLIELSFADKYWADNKKRRITADGQLVVDPKGYLQKELNFSMFFGISLMLYESTLVSDDSPVDRYFGCASPQCAAPVAPDPSALTADAVAGLAVFTGKGRCVRCHGGPAFSNAAFVKPTGGFVDDIMLKRMTTGDGGVAFYDNGFYNIGVTPASEDPGIGGTDPFGNPLSFARQYVKKLQTGQSMIDALTVDPCSFSVPFDLQDCSAVPTGASDLAKLRVAVDGAFKVPILRNVGVTPPYFHNGGAATLDQVIEFYNRGGNRRGVDGNDTTGTGPLGDGVIADPAVRGSNLDRGIGPLLLTSTERAQLKAFLLSLTDERVRCRRAPFDGPALSVPNGHSALDVAPADGRLDDLHLQIPAVGAGGLSGAACLSNTGNLFDVAP